MDKRTRVIASVLALHAYNPPGARMADLDLYNECRTAWPVGFEATTLVAFRELLNELPVWGSSLMALMTAVAEPSAMRPCCGRWAAERMPLGT
jgi:hypothetical protein